MKMRVGRSPGRLTSTQYGQKMSRTTETLGDPPETLIGTPAAETAAPLWVIPQFCSLEPHWFLFQHHRQLTLCCTPPQLALHTDGNCDCSPLPRTVSTLQHHSPSLSLTVLSQIHLGSFLSNRLSAASVPCLPRSPYC